MSSKDLSLDLVEKLDLLKKNGNDYVLIVLEPGKNTDRADIWYELRDKNSAANATDACLNFLTSLYDKDSLIDLLISYCEEVGDMDESEYLGEEPMLQKKKKKKSPPNNDGDTLI